MTFILWTSTWRCALWGLRGFPCRLTRSRPQVGNVRRNRYRDIGKAIFGACLACCAAGRPLPSDPGPMPDPGPCRPQGRLPRRTLPVRSAHPDRLPGLSQPEALEWWSPRAAALKALRVLAQAAPPEALRSLDGPPGAVCRWCCWAGSPSRPSTSCTRRPSSRASPPWCADALPKPAWTQWQACAAPLTPCDHPVRAGSGPASTPACTSSSPRRAPAPLAAAGSRVHGCRPAPGCPLTPCMPADTQLPRLGAARLLKQKRLCWPRLRAQAC